jgi:CRP-like cAMP-binding protein
MHLDPSAFVADETLIRRLDERAAVVPCGRKRILFGQGEDAAGLYILKSGVVTLTMSSLSGKDLVSIQAAPNSLLGLPALVGEQPYTLTAKASAGAQLAFIARDAFSNLMRTEPSLAFKVLEILAAEVRSARGALRGELDAPGPRSQLTPSTHA